MNDKIFDGTFSGTFSGSETNCLVFRRRYLNDNRRMDPRTFFLPWVTPIFTNTPPDTRDYLKGYPYQQYSSKAELLRDYWRLISGATVNIEQKRDYTELKEHIGQFLTEQFYMGSTIITERELQIKGVDRIFNGWRVDDKFIFGNYNGTYQIELSNPQFTHTEGTYFGDKLTDKVFVWNFVEKTLRVIDWKALSNRLKDPTILSLIETKARKVGGTASSATMVADISWVTLNSWGVYTDVFIN